jgi:hypothetical protein
MFILTEGGSRLNWGIVDKFTTQRQYHSAWGLADTDAGGLA